MAEKGNQAFVAGAPTGAAGQQPGANIGQQIAEFSKASDPAGDIGSQIASFAIDKLKNYQPASVWGGPLELPVQGVEAQPTTGSIPGLEGQQIAPYQTFGPYQAAPMLGQVIGLKR